MAAPGGADLVVDRDQELATMNDPTADSNTLRRELAELRDRLAGLERWRKAVRSALSEQRAYSRSAELIALVEALHDATDDEGAVDLSPRMSLTLGPGKASSLRPPISMTGTDEPPTEKLTRTRLGGVRPGLEEESPGGC